MKILKFLALALVATGLTVAVPASAAPAGTNMTRSFIQNATIGNGFEIMASRLALQKSRNPEVRDFAQRMINDHSQADQDLRETIMHSRFSMTRMPNNLDAKHRKILSRLERANGYDFDQKYIKAQVDAHKSAVALFANYARNGSNPDIREFARDTLPTLQEHNAHVRHIRLYR
jgi:putative membrane protein